MPLFMQGVSCWSLSRTLLFIFRQWCRSAASQPLADDAVRAVFRNEAVIRRAGGVNVLKAGYFVKRAVAALFRLAIKENMTTMTRAGRNCLCWHCDNQLRDQFTETAESRQNG